ncbi:30S ribosomal protein S19 [Candidatus Micrarchaeota archaeon]|nr:30S ribosomal protein S19 [Candidatus Micrarchaeota archaeon]
MVKKFGYRGKSIEDLKKMTFEEFIALVPAHQRRTMKRMSTNIKKFVERIRKAKAGKPVKTHVRNMVVLPEMVGMQFQVYNGKEWVMFTAAPEMLGHRLGEYSIPIKMVKHHGPGIGATRGSKAVELK